MRKFLLVTIIAMYSTISNAQISGYIVNENTVPISGAVIVLINSLDSTMITSTASGEGGIFSFSNKANGRQLLSVSMLGHATITIPAKTDMGNISMTSQAIEMRSVTVKGTSFVASSDRFTFMISNPALIVGNDAIGILKMTPLLQATDDGVSIAGKNATNVYVNGREIKLKGESIGSFLKSIPAEDIVKIEVMPVANSTFKGQGDFGIVNIILRKRETNGIKGSLSLTDKQAYYNSQNLNFNMSSRKDKVGIETYLWGGNNKRHNTIDEDKLFTTFENTVISNSVNTFNNQEFGAWIGIDYDINDKQVLGFIVNATYWNTHNRENNYSYYSKKNNSALDSTYNTYARIKIPSYNINTNINYQIKTDSLGSTFAVDVDFTNYSKQQTRITTFNKLDENSIIKNSNTLNQSNPLDITIWSGKAIYNHYFKRYGNLSMGLDNYTTNYNNKYTDDDKNFNNNNKFLFTEAISGLFVSYSNSWTKTFSTTLGFRIENAYNKGHQLANGESFSKSKTRLLPSVYLNYAINKNNNLSYALSTRLTQPNYNVLNPFKEYTSPTSYSVGNPFLEATNLFINELTYMFKGKLMVQLVGVTMNNSIDYFILPNGENGTKTTSINFGRRSQYFLNLGMYGSYFNGVWQANNRLALTYNTWKGSVEDIVIDHRAPHWFISLGNDFTLSKTHKVVFETYFWYQSNVHLTTGIAYAHSSFNLALRKSFKSLSIKIYANDIFNQYSINALYDYAGIVNYITNDNDSREFGVRLSYNFGNMKTKSNRSRETSSSAVENRL